MHLQKHKKWGLNTQRTLSINRVGIGLDEAQPIPGRPVCQDRIHESGLFHNSRMWFNSRVVLNPSLAHFSIRSKIQNHHGPSLADDRSGQEAEGPARSHPRHCCKTKTCISKSLRQTRRADGPGNPS